MLFCLSDIDFLAEKENGGGIKGIINWFNKKKGYGFITPSDGEKDIFIHWTGIDMDGFKTVNDGDSVEFEVGPGVNGPQAIHVVKIS